ncbi:MAG: hypothetical protein WC806_01425 [Candidatus Gracilibacteria bacterium]|jgi:hypothetical protein
MNDSLEINGGALEVGVQASQGEFSSKVKFIDEEATIPLGDALNFLHGFAELFPEFGDVRLPGDSIVRSTSREAHGQFCTVLKDFFEMEFVKYFTDHNNKPPNSIYFREPSPSIDELRAEYSKCDLDRLRLEFDLAYLRVNVGRALRIAYNRAYMPPLMEPYKNPQLLAAFRRIFTLVMKSIRVEFDPIRFSGIDANSGCMYAIVSEMGNGCVQDGELKALFEFCGKHLLEKVDGE